MTEMSAAEAAIVARFDAAEPASESWHVQRVARERAAAELRAAAGDILSTASARDVEDQVFAVEAGRLVRRRADALAADDRTGQR